ncbi:MAG: hypothetical protein ACRDI3_03210, partial [Actinomycetota bacterium]
WKVGAVLVGLAILVALVPIGRESVCYEGVTFADGDSCFVRFRTVGNLSLHPIVMIGLTIGLATAGLYWLLRLPAPRLVVVLMEGHGLRFRLLRGLLFTFLGAAFLFVFVILPLVIIWLAEGMERWRGWAWVGSLGLLYIFVIAFGPNNVGGRPWRGYRQASVYLGPDRSDPPDSRRY